MKSVLSLFFSLLTVSQISAQCIGLQNCLNTVEVCDYTANNSNFWNETYWQDPINQMKDLADTPVDLSLNVTDSCAGAVLSLRYLLFLDLDHNGSWETVIKSWEPPAPGTVNYNNWNNPNYEGGDVRVFDERPVPAEGKYQFALETTSAGTTTQAKLRWNTPAEPNTFAIPELPYATHKIKWLAEDNLGNSQICEHPIVVKDCKKPTVVCINGLSVNLMPTGEVMLWGSDFLQYGEDNATPTPFIEFAVRKSGSGTGFPTNPDGSPQISVTYTCAELGVQYVEVWAKDASGNADYCETYAIVSDINNNCPGVGGNDSIPTIVCLNGMSANLMPGGEIQIWASDLLQYAEDDETPAPLLEFSLQHCPADANFPVDGNGNPIESLIFDCDHLGSNCVNLWVRDQDGNATYCEVQVEIFDNFDFCPGGLNNAPTVVCINGLAVNLMPTSSITLWASDFLQYAEDDQTPANALQFSLRKSGVGTGFPLDSAGLPVSSLTFNCDEQGQQGVELWAKDLDGNAAYCETTANIQDPFEFCPGGIVLGISPDHLDQKSSVSAPFPNPTTQNAQLMLHLLEAGSVMLEVTDLQGKIQWRNEMTLKAGNHSLELGAQAMPQAGVYVWRIQTGDSTFEGRLIRM